MNRNQAPEERARDRIDDQLRASGWAVQGMAELNPAAARGVAVREYPTDTGPMDYLLMVDGEPVGLVEAKREEKGHRISRVEEQSARYANAELRHIGRTDLRFVYEATGEITRFTDCGDPAPRARFGNPPELQPDGLRDCRFRAIDNLETSLRENRPRALIQMATGAGKIFTAITSIYRVGLTATPESRIRTFPNVLPCMCPNRQLSASEANLPPGTFYV